MCLAIPAQVVEILPEQRAWIDVGGIQREISTILVDALAVGDYVIVHVGYALSRLDHLEAEKTLALFQQLSAQEDHP